MRPARGRASPTPDWEAPYIPPGGLVDQCLLPDGCGSCDDPVMSLPIRPLRDIDHPLLKQALGADPEGEPLWSLDSFMAKQWAGNPEKPHPCARPRTFPKDPSPLHYDPDMAYSWPRRSVGGAR